MSVCTHCHGLNYILEKEFTAAQWENTVYDMIARGAPVEAEELDLLKDYLIENYAVGRD